MSPKPKILIIVGPTASGKTALALRLANGRPVSIISADSRQIYEGLDILTGKDIPKILGTIRLFGFNLIRPNESMNAAEYSDYARRVIAEETRKKRQVIIVGGTGFYLKAITDPQSLAQVPPQSELRGELSAISLADLQQRLWEIDPERFMTLNDSDVRNHRRLIRAIEVASSKSFPELVQLAKFDQSYSFIWLGLSLPLDQIKERIAHRVAVRLDEAIAEVKTLQKNYPDRSLPIYTSLGVKPILKYLAGEISREEMKESWISDEVNYAKRQFTWFKKQKEIIWYDQGEVRNLSLNKLL